MTGVQTCALPISTEVLRYGQRVAVLALPCHELLRTPQALAVVGPQAFGLEGVVFRPLARAKRIVSFKAEESRTP